MEKIRFLNDNNVYDGKVSVCGNVIALKFTDTLPPENILINGFELLNENNGLVQGDYTTFTTIYRTYPDDNIRIELSNDGRIYVPPVIPPKPEPYVPTPEELAYQELQDQIREIESQIIDLKNELTSTDYKIIKEYEYYLVGKESEYDANELHQERQEIRDKINTLEQELQTLYDE